MLRVEGPCASIDTRSVFGAELTRSFHRRVKYSSILPSSAMRSAGSSALGLMALFMVATSLHQVSRRRSCSGKSNSVASISVVSSIDTLSTQLKVSLRGRLSSTWQVRSRISGSIVARLGGATIGVTALRCSSCTGGSIAMNILSFSPSGGSVSVMPPSDQSDENTAWLVSTDMMSW